MNREIKSKRHAACSKLTRCVTLFFLLFRFSLGNHLFGNMWRHFFVMIKPHRKTAASLRHGTQISGILQHFSHGTLANNLVASGGFPCQECVRDGCSLSPIMSPINGSGTVTSTYIIGSSKMGFAAPFPFKRQAGSNLKRHLRGINAVIGTVIKACFDIYHGKPARIPNSIASRSPFPQREYIAAARPPPKILSSNSNPSPVGSGENSIKT